MITEDQFDKIIYRVNTELAYNHSHEEAIPIIEEVLGRKFDTLNEKEKMELSEVLF